MARFGRTEAPLTRRALITGITGQDGSYLAEYLLTQGYEVWGLVRGQSNPRVRGVRQLFGDIRLVRGDLLDQGSLIAEASASDLRAGLGAVSGGMRPKLQACLEGVEGGVETAVIVDGRVAHSLLVELFTDSGQGTMIRGDQR